MSAKPNMNEAKFLGMVVHELLLDRVSLMRNRSQENLLDLDEECGYKKVLTLSDYTTMIERDGIAKRYVCLYPDECWTADPEIIETHEDGETENEKRLNEVFEDAAVFHYLHRIDEVSGYGAYGLLFMAFNDGKKLHQPVTGSETLLGRKPRGRPRTSAPQLDLMFLRVFDQSRCRITEKDTDETSARFGEPLMYEIDFADVDSADSLENNATGPQAPQVKGKKSGESNKLLVHWSRVLHVADGRVSNELFGTPRLKPVYNRIQDLQKLLGGSAEMFYKGAFPGLALETPDNLPDNVPFDTDSIKAEMREYYKKLKRYVAFRNLKVKTLAPNVAPPEEHIHGHFQALAVAAACPLRVLLGTEEGRLGSNQDARNWNKKLRSRQTKYLTPMLLRPFLRRLAAYGVIADIPWIIEWPDLNAPTREDQADIAVKLCNALFKYTASSAGKHVIGPKALLSMVLGFTPAQVKIAMSSLNAQMDGMQAAAARNQAAGARGKTRPSTQSRDPTMSAATGQSKA